MNPAEIQRILSQLPAGDRDKVQEHLEDLNQSARQSAMAAIMVRGFSHGVGVNINFQPGKEEK